MHTVLRSGRGPSGYSMILVVNVRRLGVLGRVRVTSPPLSSNASRWQNYLPLRLASTRCPGRRPGATVQEGG
jgi:hypothetical protein